jgi:hypothetical protein
MDMGPGAPTPSLVTQGIATGREKVLAPVPIQEIPESDVGAGRGLHYDAARRLLESFS